ncbi:MAG: hypothetical protein ACTSQJ_12955 [Promethearchaeota archaeon]
MIIYVDTNVLISQYDPSDVFREINLKILNIQDIKFLTGMITVLEFKCVFGRLWRENKIKISAEMSEILSKLSDNLQIKVLTDFCFKKLNVPIISIEGAVKLRFIEEEHKTNKNFFTAIKLANILPLRTLDMLQIATAANIKHYSDFDIDFFLTNDSHVLKSSQFIRKHLNIIPVSSNDLNSLLKEY